MYTGVKKRTFIQPKTMAELLPELSSILSKDAGQTLTVRKQPRPTIYQTRTTQKAIKPLTIAELRTAITALKIQSPTRNPQPNTASKKPKWNSSVKTRKTKSHATEGHFSNTSVRKVLNFQPKPKPDTNVRATLKSSETPKFPRQELRAKKSLHLLEKNSIRISGIYNIPPTPVIQNKIARPQMTLQQSNKENKTYQVNINRKRTATPKKNIQRKFEQTFQDTPLSNLSFKSNGDASFLLKEKEINDIEERTKALGEEPILQNIAEVPPPILTPFNKYRNVKKFFDNTCGTEISYNDNTLITFDKISVNEENDKREKGVIVSLCDMLSKAAVTNTNKTNTELNDLLEVEKQTQQNIQMIQCGIQTLNNIKESHLKSLQYVRKLINEKKNLKSDGDIHATSIHVEIGTPASKESTPEKRTILRPSVIKAKSPSYKIPRKNMCLRKKVISKSMPNESIEKQTPSKSTDKALNMYMQIKEKMNFLNTPLVKQDNLEPPDTPSLTSHNLQKQLDKLYNGS